MKFASHPLQLALGFTVWSVWFVAVYGGLSLACAISAPAPEHGALTWINLVLAVLTLATLLTLLWCAWVCWRLQPQAGAPRFVAPVAAGLHLAAAVATLFVGLPLVRMPPCV